jgi:ComF family protein
MTVGDRWEPAPAVRDLVDFALRPVCLLCREPLDAAPPFSTGVAEGLVCPACVARIEPLPGPLCPRCGAPADGRSGSRCPTCRRNPDGPEPIRSAVRLTGIGGKLIHLFKYRGRKQLAEMLALEIVSAPWSTAGFWDVDRLVPVPASRVRLRERGYNQSVRLADALSRLVGVPCESGALLRRAWHRSQVGLPPRLRRENVRGAFAVPEGARARVAGLRVMIVDDVITTGATVRACCEALRGAGAAAVSCVSFGRAESTDDF